MVQSGLLFLSCTAARVSFLTMTVVKPTLPAKYCITPALFHTVGHGWTLSLTPKITCLCGLTVAVNSLPLFYCGRWNSALKKYWQRFSRIRALRLKTVSCSWKWLPTAYGVKPQVLILKTMMAKSSLNRGAGLPPAMSVSWRKPA